MALFTDKMDQSVTTMSFLLDNSSRHTQNTMFHELPDQTTLSIVITISYAVVFLFGVIGNVLVIFVICRNPDMSTATNIFLVNLTVADLLVLLVCMPIGLIELYAKDVWLLGSFMCKFASFLEISVTNASVMTMLSISFERYYAICRPLEVLYTCTRSRAAKIILSLWVFSILSATPFLFISYTEFSKFHDQSIHLVCRNLINTPWKHVYNWAIFTVFFLVPCAILMILYTCICRELLRSQRSMAHSTSKSFRLSVLQFDKDEFTNGTSTSNAPLKYTNRRSRTVTSRRQVIYMLIAVIVFSFACLLPFRIVALWIVYSPISSKTQLGIEGMLIVLHLSRILFYTNSAGNPILYNMISTKFREASKRCLDIMFSGNNRSRCPALGSDICSKQVSTSRRFESSTKADVIEFEFIG